MEPILAKLNEIADSDYMASDLANLLLKLHKRGEDISEYIEDYLRFLNALNSEIDGGAYKI